jgi:hypothetical protein|tara:strand:- start:2614 stop:3396 length:783 start_codon:yes stop_codon:yes gene_type:complete
MLYLLYVITGAVGGFIGGFLGLGGGIIFVPSLFYIFTYFQIQNDYVIQSAVSTSLACVVISSLSATIKHYKNQLINWKIFYKMLPGLTLGSLSGVLFITIFPSNVIKLFYSILLIIIAIYIFFEKENNIKSVLKFKFVHFFSYIIGTVSALLGIGGGTLTTPYFKTQGESLKSSIATAAACGVPIASFGIILSIILNTFTNSFHTTILNYINLSSFILISSSAILFSYFGAATTFSTNTSLLKNIFSLSILIIGITIFFF